MSAERRKYEEFYEEDLSGGEEDSEEPYVKYWRDKTMAIAGKTFKALKAWGNVSLCSECGKPIRNIPLILWDEHDTSKALTFHFYPCAEKLGILKLISKSVEIAHDEHAR